MNNILVKALNEICKEENINITSFSKDWVFRLEKDGVVKFINGFKFPCNDMSVAEICNDKIALSDILNFYKISHIEHIPVFDTDYESVTDDFLENILKYSDKAVVKENKGSCGRNIFICNNVKEIREKLEFLFNTEYLVAISPFYEIDFEYRVIMVNNKPEIIYGKKIKSVVGDGTSTIEKLCKNLDITTEYLDEKTLKSVPNKDEKVKLSSFHNLSKYGEFFENIEENVKEKLTKIAVDVTKNIGINFCSVDIVKCEHNYKVLEVNSGVMAEKYGLGKNFNKVKEVYKKALLTSFQ